MEESSELRHDVASGPHSDGSQVVTARRRPSRGMYVLPSVFTAGNIAAGFYAITQAVHAAILLGVQGAGGDYSGFDHAALAIGFAVLLCVDEWMGAWRG